MRRRDPAHLPGAGLFPIAGTRRAYGSRELAVARARRAQSERQSTAASNCRRHRPPPLAFASCRGRPAPGAHDRDALDGLCESCGPSPAGRRIDPVLSRSTFDVSRLTRRGHSRTALVINQAAAFGLRDRPRSFLPPYPRTSTSPAREGQRGRCSTMTTCPVMALRRAPSSTSAVATASHGSTGIGPPPRTAAAKAG
jgi:hypothetical protein